MLWTNSYNRWDNSPTYELVITTPATGQVVTLQEAKQYAGVEDSETYWDNLFLEWIASSTDDIEKNAGLSLLTQKVDFSIRCFHSGIKLKGWPVQSIEEINYFDPDGVETLLDPSVYEFIPGTRPALIDLAPGQTWPAVQVNRRFPIRISMTTGFDSAGNPDTRLFRKAQQALKVFVATYYDFREVEGDRTVSMNPNNQRIAKSLSIGDEFTVYG